jgi:hypothetical protein
MKQEWLHIGGWALGLLLALSGCAKSDYETGTFPTDAADGGTTLAIGTFRIQEGVPTVRIDAATLAYVTNRQDVADLADGTRIFFEYSARNVQGIPDFCTEAVYVHWASALDVGDIRYDLQYSDGDPVDVVKDWITTLEDGFLTIHYSVYASGSVQHDFSLYPTASLYGYRLVHDAHGDSGGSLTDGIICFPVGALLPDTGGQTVTLSLDYLNLQNTRTRLTVDYRSPE